MTIQMASMGLVWGYRDLSPLSSSWSDTGVATVTYEVRWFFENDGTADEYRAQNSDNVGLRIILPGSKASETWVRCTENSGLTLTTGTPGTWQQLSSNRTFAIARNLLETGYNITFELATDSSGTDIVSSKTVSGTVGRIV